MAEPKTSCSKCGGHIAFPKELAGQEIECPHCRELILLPKFKLSTAWIITVIFAAIIVCLVFALFWQHHTNSAKLKQTELVTNGSRVSKDTPTKLGDKGQPGEETEEIRAIKNLCRDYYNAINNQDFKALQDVLSESGRKVLSVEDVKGIVVDGRKYEFINLESVRFQDGASGKYAAAKARRTEQNQGMQREGLREFRFIKDPDGWKIIPTREISDGIVSQFFKSGFSDQVKEKIRLLRDGDPLDSWDKNDTNALAAVFKLSQGESPVFPWDVEFRVENNSIEGLILALNYSVRNNSSSTWNSPLLEFTLKRDGKVVLSGNDLLADISSGRQLVRNTSLFLPTEPQETTKFDLDVDYSIGFPRKSIRLAHDVPIELKVKRASELAKLEIISTQFDLATSEDFQNMLSARINYRVKNISTEAIKSLDIKCVWFSQAGEQLDQSTEYAVGYGDVPLSVGQFKTGFIRCGKGYRDIRVPVKVDVYLESGEKRSLVYKGLLIK